MADGNHPAPKRPQLDWAMIEVHYRAGVLSLHQIAKQFGCSHTAIRKKAERDGWTRDLTNAVRKVADAKMTEDLAFSQDGSQRKPVTGNQDIFRETVAAAAEAMVKLVRQHRAQLHRDNELIQGLVDKIESLMPMIQTLGQVGDAMSILEALTRIRARLIPLERQAFNLDPRRADDPAKGIGKDDDGDVSAAAEAFRLLEEAAAAKAGGYAKTAAMALDGAPGPDHPAGE